MVEAPVVVKRRRNCGPKTRTGCHTCKIRRVKCDEFKPSCNRCTSTGRKCDGYAQDILSKADDPNSLAIVRRLAAHSISTHSQGERRGFDYFVNETAEELSGFFSTGFWKQLLLQASAGDVALRHGVVAIGALHEEFKSNRLVYSPEPKTEGQIFAVNQYTKAIQQLRKSLSGGKQTTVTALMSCILFIGIDSVRGQFDSALMHLRSGLQILKDLKRRSPEDVHLIAKHITPLFVRLTAQSILYIDTRSTAERRELVQHLSDLCAEEPEIPEMFQTLDEARDHMNYTANGAFRMMYQGDGNLPMIEQPAQIWELRPKYEERLKLWNAAYARFMAAKCPTMNGKELRGAALLKIHHITVSLMMSAVPSENDIRTLDEAINDHANFRPFIEEFRTIVGLSESLITAAERDAANGKPALTFSTDLGIVGPLYYVCIRCLDKDVKEKALELLDRCPRREGMWDSMSGSKMIKEFWNIEEKCREINEAHPGELPLPMSSVVDMVIGDGMKWEWKLRYPLDTLMAISRAQSAEFSDSSWMDMFEEKAYNDFLDLSPPSDFPDISTPSDTSRFYDFPELDLDFGEKEYYTNAFDSII